MTNNVTVGKKNGCIAIVRDNEWLDFSTGWGNGYVLIPKGHPLFERDYEDIKNISVHGWLTYSEKSDDVFEIKGMWAFGFDTAHLGDTPATWPKSAVILETLDLLDQLGDYDE